MAKRGSNIYRRKDGRFEGRVPVGYDEKGKIKYKSVYAHTLSEVREKMSAVHSVKQNSGVVSLKLTVRDVAEQWLSSAKLRVKQSSYANYENIVLKHILPVLGGEYMSNLTTNKLNDFIHFKLKSGRLVGKRGYTVKSNRESGKGRSDITICEFQKRRNAVIIEIKVAENFNELDKRCDYALQQIEDKMYEAELKEQSYQNVIKYGVAFAENTCRIRKK